MMHYYDHYPMNRQMYWPQTLMPYLLSLGSIIGGLPPGVGQQQYSIPYPQYGYGPFGQYGYPPTMYPGMSWHPPQQQHPQHRIFA